MSGTGAPDLHVLALGPRIACRPVSGEVYGLRLADGGCLPGLVLHAYEGGLYAGSSLLWVLARRQRGPELDLAVLSGSRPLLPPLIVHRELWAHGGAFLAGRLAPDHPLLRARVVVTNSITRRSYDLADRLVEQPGTADVVAKDSLVFLRGLDQRLRRLVSVAAVAGAA
jgi:hypothetical protein